MSSNRLSWLREALGNAPLMQTANKVARVLTSAGIPHLIVGGLAVQEYGYVRTTLDVDVVVPNVDDARDYLFIRGFNEVAGNRMKVVDRANHVDVDLLPGGSSVGPCLVNLPVPTQVGDKPNFISIEGLVTQKLSSYLANKISHAKDLGDVVELIKTGLPRELAVFGQVRNEYLRLWDGLHS